jgi:hypothetical protein
MSKTLTDDEIWKKKDEILSTKKELYTKKEILNLLKEDKFKFSFSGHIDKKHEKLAIERAKDSIISFLEFQDTYHREGISELEEAKNKGEDFKCASNCVIKLEDIDREIQYHETFIKIFEEKKIKETGPISENRAFNCFKCGMDLGYILLDENTIGLGASYSMMKKDVWDCTCPFKDGEKGHSYYITIPTGKLVISNYFDDSKPYTENDKNRDCYIKDKKEMEIFEPKDKWSRELSLNSHAGRIGLMNHYSSKHNIAFGQMGNMSIGIYVNKAKNRVVISSAYLNDIVREKDHPSYSKAKKFLKEYELAGSISLEVWRWMAADISVLEKNEIPICTSKKREFRDKNVLVEVNKGKWKVTHKFNTDDYDEDKGDIEYSVLEKEETK